jgi:serine/threonine-protein kinase
MTGSYRLAGRIETGDLAELYKASHDASGDVVVKLFHPKTSDPTYARVLAETSRVLNPLNHAGIVHYVDIGFVKQRLAVVREHVDGYTLGTALQRLNTKEVILPSALALYLIIHLLEMVQKAHDAGVIHGAITPGNLLLSREGAPGICDFGALKALTAVPELKRGFATRGRSAYRAPEVGRGEEPTAASDVYSLGAIAYELLTLREAVVAAGNLSTRAGGLPPPSRLDRRINSRLDPIILRALDPFPNRRFRSAADFAGALRNFFSSHGGMPGHEDLRRFVRELVPNEVNLSTLGPVPFSEPFRLTAVSGAEIAHVRAERLELSVVARPSFSRALSEEESSAETTETAPVFEEFKPEQWSVKEATQLTTTKAPAGAWSAQESTQLGPPEQEHTQASHPMGPATAEPVLAPTAIRPALAEPTLDPTAIRPPMAEPTLDTTPVDAPRAEPYAPLEPTRANQPPPVAAKEDTEPSKVQPVEQGWNAPPGVAPPKPRKSLAPPAGAGNGREGTHVGRNPRMKWVEDFSEEKTRIADEAKEPPPPQPSPPSKKGTGSRSALPPSTPERPPPSLVRAPPADEPTSVYVPRDRPEVPMPPPTSDNVPVSGDGRRLLTEERNLMAMAQRRHKALGVALAIAMVGFFSFALAVWQFGDKPPVEQPRPPPPVAMDPRASAISGAVDQYGTPVKPPQVPRVPSANLPDDREDSADTPRPDANSAFITLRTNVPARVIIDGTPIRKRTPLTKYPVKAGTRNFTLEAVGTKERVDFTLRFERGQHRTMEQQFATGSRR